MQVLAYQLKALELTIQLSHCNTSKRIDGVLELVVNCIPWRQKIHEGNNNNDDNDNDNKDATWEPETNFDVLACLCVCMHEENK